MEIGNISRLRRQDDFYLNEAPAWMRVIWPRLKSFTWFLKNHRSRLKTEGALIRLGRDYFIEADRFAHVASAILGIPSQCALDRPSAKEPTEMMEALLSRGAAIADLPAQHDSHGESGACVS